ncbi:MAG: hypothetical protein IJ111_14025 [Eggerthellaceae bacterium]|nr:hypothetical protein [Eggerthellaceae bacterium]
MPSWNIHTAHVERLLAEHAPESLGISDANIFLFGNYVPDVYLGFMVHGTTFRLDYCLTHLARPNIIPVPDADQFWNDCIWRVFRRPKTEAGMSLALGVWAHLVADRMYNMRFRQFCQTRDVPKGDELRLRKQADYDLFGHSLGIKSHVKATPELLEVAKAFREYSILPDDVQRTIDVADAIVNTDPTFPTADDYQLLNSEWMNATFDACNERLALWLQTWMSLQTAGEPFSAADVRAAAGLPAATPDNLDWLKRPGVGIG